MDTKFNLLAATCLLTTSVLSQATCAVTALTPITASVTESGVTYAQTLPAGPLASMVNVNSWAPSPSATHAAMTSFCSVSSEVVIFGCSIEADAASATANASVAQVELLLSISAPMTMGVSLEVAFVDETLAGSLQPSIDVDIFNDGTIDYVNGMQVAGLPAITVGPQPLQMRLLLDAQASQFQRSDCGLSIAIRPLTPVTVFQTALGCSATLNSLTVRRSFVPQAVHFRRQAIGQSPLLVLGLAMQPVLLPPTFRPCLLVPSVDVVIPMTLSEFNLVIPQSVRPLSFQAQAVATSMGNLVVTDAFSVFAN